MLDLSRKAWWGKRFCWLGLFVSNEEKKVFMILTSGVSLVKLFHWLTNTPGKKVECLFLKKYQAILGQGQSLPLWVLQGKHSSLPRRIVCDREEYFSINGTRNHWPGSLFWAPLLIAKNDLPYFRWSTWGLYYKTVWCRNLRIFVISLSVCPWQPLQTSLLFVGKARSLS